MKRKLKYFIITGIILSIITIAFIITANSLITNNAKCKTYFSVNSIPKNHVGMILGTTKILKNGRKNLYFYYRINAAVKLYNAKKIDIILISGDNSNKYYDETSSINEELIKRGIPKNVIRLDYAGLRTLDSVVRAKKIFGVNKLTIISQKFHNERAIYIADINQIDAIGFNAKDVTRIYGIKIIRREYLARVKVFIDILFNIEPKFLGKKETI